MILKDAGKAIVHKVQRLFSSQERSNADMQWRQISELVVPNHSGLFAFNGIGQTFPSSVPLNTKNTTNLYDTTAVEANRTLASNIYTATTNPNTDWSRVTYDNEALNNDRESMLWMEEVNKAINTTFNNSNLYMELSKCYTMYTGLGNMILLEDADLQRGGARFKALHIANVVWEEDAYGKVDSIYYKVSYTVQQVFELWGINALDDMEKLLEQEPEREIKYIHAIFARDKKDIKFNSLGLAEGKHRPYASIFVSEETGKISFEDGYYEFPCAAARFDLVPGERYGRGPGHVALPDIKTVNKLRMEMLTSIALSNRPPLKVIPTDILGSLNLVPGGILSMRNLDSVQPLNLNLRPDIAASAIDELRAQVNKIFMIDKLMLPPRNEIGEMSAAEVRQRAEEIQRVFGPNLARLNTEFLEPLVIRTFKMLLRTNSLPPMPEAVKQLGLPINVTFINRFSRVQQLEGVSNILGFLAEVGQIAQLDPTVLDGIDVDEAMTYIARTRSIPEIMLRTDDEVNAMRDQRNQQAAMQQQLDSGVQLADINSKL